MNERVCEPKILLVWEEIQISVYNSFSFFNNGQAAITFILYSQSETYNESIMNWLFFAQN